MNSITAKLDKNVYFNFCKITNFNLVRVKYSQSLIIIGWLTFISKGIMNCTVGQFLSKKALSSPLNDASIIFTLTERK